MDKATVGGVLIALGGILAGLLLEGGNLGQILQPTAAMIVFGGTLGAVLIQFPLPVVLGALRRLGHIFAAPRTDPMGDRPGTCQICESCAPRGNRLSRSIPGKH